MPPGKVISAITRGGCAFATLVDSIEPEVSVDPEAMFLLLLPDSDD